jgi:16S rRNA C1402 (ribose-2'-O) methylase RsmI
LKKRKKVVKNLEKISQEKNRLKFYWNSYRNNKMLEDILQALHPENLFVYRYWYYFTNNQNEESICLEKKYRSAQ